MFATVKHIVSPNQLLTVLVSAPIFFGFQVHGHDLTAVSSVVLSESLTLQTLALGLFPWGTEEWGLTGAWIKPLLWSQREDHWHSPMKATSIKETSWVKKRSIFIFQVLFHGSLYGNSETGSGFLAVAPKWSDAQLTCCPGAGAAWWFLGWAGRWWLRGGAIAVSSALPCNTHAHTHTHTHMCTHTHTHTKARTHT